MVQYYGPSTSMYGYYIDQERKQQELAKQQRDADYYSKWGYFPEQRFAAKQAQEAAEAEWQKLVQELEGRAGEIRNSDQARRLEEYYSGVMSGQDRPFDERTIASITSRATNPIFRNASGTLQRLREAFAARGLGRSGGLGSMEAQTLTNAATGAAAQSGQIRSDATLQNFGARERGAQGYSNFYGNQQSMLNNLSSELARYRSQRAYDVSQFGRAGSNPQGGYSPPAPLERRQTGASAPTYNTQRVY